MAMPIHNRIQKLRQLPPGRAHQAASNVARVALPLGYVMLAPHIDAARDAARAYLHLRTRRFGERAARGDGAASRIDRMADIRVAFIYDNLRRYAVDLADTDEGRTAEDMLRRHFPRGLGAVTNAPFEEELLQLEAIVEAMTGDDADAAAALAIDHHVAALRPLVVQYAHALDQEDRVTPEALKAGWQAVHHGVLELAFAIVTHVRDPEHRARALGPIFEQDDRLAALYAARQRGQSVPDLDLDAEALDADGADPIDDVPVPGDVVPDPAEPDDQAPVAADGAEQPGDAAPDAAAPAEQPATPRPVIPLPTTDD